MEIVTTPAIAEALTPEPEIAPTVRSNGLSNYFRPATMAFWGMHAAAIVGVILVGFSWTGLLLAVGAYFARMVLVTLAYHRYFSHRSFRTSRAFQFLLALGAQSAAQKGVLWWAAHHRFHHKHSDTPLDPHSAKHRGFWFSHLFGKRRYQTTDESRNNWALALLTTGEGWHNNHHHYQSSANQGFRWWEVDVTFYVLRFLERLGLVWDLRRPPREIVSPTT